MAFAPHHPIISHTISSSVELITWASSYPEHDLIARLGYDLTGPSVITDAVNDWTTAHGKRLPAFSQLQGGKVIGGVKILAEYYFVSD